MSEHCAVFPIVELRREATARMAVEQPPGSDLVRRAKGGEIAAFERLYRSHADRVYGLCLRMVGDRARAEDLTQETFVRTWKKLPTFRGESSFGTWLHRVAVNVVLAAERSRQRKSAPLVAVEEAFHVNDPAGRRRDEIGIDLQRAIRALPTRARLVFVLHDVQGYGHGEIAALTGMASGTSKAHLHRARKLLRKALTE